MTRLHSEFTTTTNAVGEDDADDDEETDVLVLADPRILPATRQALPITESEEAIEISTEEMNRLGRKQGRTVGETKSIAVVLDDDELLFLS